MMLMNIPALNDDSLNATIPALAFNFDLTIGEASFDSP